MSITTEVLNTTFADLRGPLVNSFMRSSELWMMLQKKSKMPIDGGTFFERTFAGGAPARGVGVFVGDELLNMQRRQEIRRYQVEPHRLVIAINIPNKELQMNSGQRAVVRLLEEYPKTTLEAASGVDPTPAIAVSSLAQAEARPRPGRCHDPNAADQIQTSGSA